MKDRNAQHGRARCQLGRGVDLVRQGKNEASRNEASIVDRFRLEFSKEPGNGMWPMQNVKACLKQDLVQEVGASHFQHIRSKLGSQTLDGLQLSWKLGKGGFSDVFLGAVDGKLVAIKALHNEHNRHSYLKEARLMCKLHRAGRAVPALLGWYFAPVTKSTKQLGLVDWSSTFPPPSWHGWRWS